VGIGLTKKHKQMAVKIRLQRKGRKKAPFYHIVIADSRSPRDGKFIQNIGMYNPISKPAIIELDRDAAFKWLMQGAEPTDTVKAILKYKGVMYRKHLSRGVAKGSFSQEKADEMYLAWVDQKEGKILDKVSARKAELEAINKKLVGTKKEKPAPVVVEEAVSADTEAENVAETPSEDVSSTEETKAEE